MKSTKKEFNAFRALFLAPSMYGKSYLVSQFVIDHLKQKHFNPKRVVLFSKTYKTDSSQQMLVEFCKEKYKKFEEKNCMEEIDVAFLLKLFDSQKMIKETNPNKMKNWCLVFDDMISENILTQKKSPLTEFFCLGRHFGISIIMSLQSYRGTLSTICRNQMTIIAMGRLSSQGQIEDMLDEYNAGCGKSKKECNQKMMEFFEDAIQDNDNHGFLIIWTMHQFGQGRLQKGFKGKFYDKQ